jgi:hypothetical protein
MIHEEYGQIIASLSDFNMIDEQVRSFIEISDLPRCSQISLAIDMFVLNPDFRCLLASGAENVFVFYTQSPDSRFQSFPLHMMPRF